jgi:hypothetical protein
MDPRAGLDDVEKRKLLTLPGLELRTLGRPARSQSLYRLRYFGFHLWMTHTIYFVCIKLTRNAGRGPAFSQFNRDIRYCSNTKYKFQELLQNVYFL